MIEILAVLLCGFTIFSGLLLAATQVYQRESCLYAWALTLAVWVIQGSHVGLFMYGELPSAAVFSTALFAIGPSLYLFIKAQLSVARTPYSLTSLAHFIPLVLAWLLPYSIALPVAFLIGGAYLFWLFRLISKMRDQSEEWQQEVSLLILALIFGTAVFVLGLSTPLLNEWVFHVLYAMGIGVVFLLIHLALLWSPGLPEAVSEVAQQAYAASTLKHVDHDEKLHDLKQLMTQEKVYQEPDLKLANLAQRLGLSGHQLSELINTHHGVHFSRYVREYRVEAAQQLLISKPALSVLDVGMQVGFSSQSTFYDAFRDLTGTTPAKYRKINL